MKWMYFFFVLMSVIFGQTIAAPELIDTTTKLPEIKDTTYITTTTTTTTITADVNNTNAQTENRRAYKDDAPKDVQHQTPNPAKPIQSAKEKSTAKAHAGIAIPMTMEEIEREIAEVDNHVIKETSTAKEGISTWILLSGTNPTGKPINKGPAYRIESESNIEKLEKLAKIDENIRPKEIIKNKYKAAKPITTTTMSPSLLSVNVESNETAVRPNRPNANNNNNPRKKVEPSRPTKPTTTVPAHKRKPATTTTKAPITRASTTKSTTQFTTQSSINDEESATFIIMEAKDADFNLPQDRSPGKPNKVKRPNVNQNNKNKKKTNNNKKDKIDESSSIDNLKNSTKSVNNNNKIKDTKPVTTQIYNYFAREVMPTVGVGLIGLVVTAGLAGYFFGPLGALRRSYDIADRKDDLYYYNNEEYAGPDGQSEEDMFGKVIAGMPLNTNYKNNANIRYAGAAAGPNPYQQPQQQNGAKYSGYQQQQQQQYTNNRYPGRPQMPYINYQSNVKQPFYQKNHIHNQNSVLKKSISSPVYRTNQQQSPILAAPIIEVVTASPSTTTKQTPNTPSTTLPTTVNSQTEALSINPSAAPLRMEQQSDTQSSIVNLPVMSAMDYHTNDIMQRTAPQQFVVGSVLPDVINGDDDTMAAPVPEHGPRRRRRRSLDESSVDNTLKPIENLYTNLKQKYSKAAKNDKIAKEMKNIDYEIQRLRRISAEVKDIVQFQNEFHIGGLNSDLRDTIANGVAHIQGNIQFVNELLDNPGETEKKMNERKKMQGIVSSKTKMTNYPTSIQSKMDVIATNASVPTAETPTNGTMIVEPPVEDNQYNGTTSTVTNNYGDGGADKQPTGLMGLLKLLELKAQFGINLMRSVRPAFNKAFRDVFNATQSTAQLSPQNNADYRN